jgi:hypothetical protein
MYKKIVHAQLNWLASTIGTLKVPGLLPSDYQLGNLQMLPP